MASRSEAERYLQLKELEANGTIENLRCQVSYDLVVANALICRYRADFTYDVAGAPGRPLRHVVEDVKGMITPEFRLKRKLFDALQPVTLSVIELGSQLSEEKWGSLVWARCGPGPTPSSGAGWLARHWRGRLPE